MKSIYLKIAMVMAISAALMSCEDEQVRPTDEPQANTDETSELVKFKSQLDNATFNLFSSGFRGSSESGRKLGVHRFSRLFSSREEAARATEEWDTCALVTITENEDGTYTVILNFGEGCEEADGRFLEGIVAFTGSETDSSGVFQIGFENFAERHPEDSVENHFTLSGWYHGEWGLHPSVEFDYAEGFAEVFELNYENGDQESFSAEGQFLANETAIAVTKHDFSGTNAQGDVFSGVTVEPLIYKYSCTESSIYVKGTEVYNFNGESASVDFGDGTCDNILTIQADGITIIIDLDEVN